MKPINKGGSLLEPNGSNNPHGGRWNVRVILCCAIMAVCMVAMYFRCDQNVLLGDDLFYRYVLPAEELTTPNIGRQVTTISDALESQSNQYFHTNGRFPVHVVVQLLSGSYPSPAFAIVSALLIGAVITMFMTFSVRKHQRINPLWWMAAALIWFYLFPASDHLWYEVATGMNYLLPMALVLGWALIWRRMMAQSQPRVGIVIAACIVGAFTGWSQEGFAVPLSGGMFIYAVINRRKLDLRRWLPLLCLWGGTAALVFASGNHHRVSDGGGLTGHLLNGINLYFQVILVWLTVAIIIIARCVAKPRLAQHFKRYSAWWYTCIIAILFGLFANTYPQSFTGIEFYSLIIGFSLTAAIIPDKTDRLRISVQCILSGLFLIAFCAHQCLIISESMKVKAQTESFISDYMQSPDGIMTMDDYNINPLARPWVNMALRHDAEWALYSLSVAYASNMRPIVILTGDETLLLTAPDRFFTSSRLIPGSAHAYLSNKIWVKGATNTPLKANLLRSNRQPTEKIINLLTNSAGKTFQTEIPPKMTITVNGQDTLTLYLKPSFYIVSIDRN